MGADEKTVFITEEALGQVTTLLGEERTKLLDFMNEAIGKKKTEADAEVAAAKKKADEKEAECVAAKKKADDAEAEKADLKKKADEKDAEIAAGKKKAEEDGKAKDDQVKAEIKEAKKVLGEKVNAFLTNLVPQLKAVVSEELKLSPDHVNAESIVAKLKNILGESGVIPASNIMESTTATPPADTAKVGELEAKVKELTESAATLTEKVTRKETILSERETEVQKLKGSLKAWELCSGDGDRDYLMKQLAECKDEQEVAERFAELKQKLRRDAETDLLEQFNDPTSGGPGKDQPATNESRLDESPLNDLEKLRLAELAGIK